MPYGSNRAGVIIKSVRARLDDHPLVEVRAGDTLSSGKASWERALLQVSVFVVPGVLEAVVPTSERASPPLDVLVSARCAATYISRSARGGGWPGEAGLATCEFTLLRGDVFGEVLFTPFLVRSAEGRSVPGFAGRKGAWVARGEPWLLPLDVERSPSGNYLEIVRVKFSERPEIPKEDRGGWYFLEAEGPAPRLLLNEERPTLISALCDPAGRGGRAHLRDAIFEFVEATVWPALVFSAAKAWSEDDGAPYPWQENVLRLWARRLLLEDDGETSGVAQLVDRARSSPSAVLLEIAALLQRKDGGRRFELLHAEVGA